MKALEKLGYSLVGIVIVAITVVAAALAIPGCQTAGLGITTQWVAPMNPVKVWRVPATAPTTQPLRPNQSYKPASGTVLDFGGQLIDARGIPKVAGNGAPVAVLFNIAYVSDVTIRNASIIGDSGTSIVSVIGSRNVRIENIRLYSAQDDADQCLNGILINGCTNVTVSNFVADLVNKYLVYCDTSDNVSLDGCQLTIGSRTETGCRFMYAFTHVTISNCEFRAEPDLCPAKQMALRVHASGRNVQISGCKFFGGVTLGHMTGGDGGQYEPDPTKRKTILGYRLQDITMQSCTVDGWIDMEPGLERSAIVGCTINGRISRVNAGGNPGQKITWGYPDKAALKPGDVPIAAPACTFIDTKFTSATGKSPKLFLGNTNGPASFKFIGCQYDSKPFKG